MEGLSLREIQLAELEILVEFDRLCQEHNLRYSLDGGTLLGAIRHKGFIPWDDDIDVMMPRDDYDRFCSLWRSGAFSVPAYFSLTTDGEEDLYPFVKMQDHRVLLRESTVSKLDYLWIDIFPVDGLPDDRKKAQKIFKKSAFYGKVLAYAEIVDLKHYAGRHNRLVAYAFYLYSKLFTAKRAHRKIMKLTRICPYARANKCGKVTWTWNTPDRILSKSSFDHSATGGGTYAEFEGHRFQILSEWDLFLRASYGDYMQIPDENHRPVHGFFAYPAEDAAKQKEAGTW